MWQDTRTNLYHDHAECKYIRFLSDRISSLVNLWRGPRRSVFIGLRCGVHSTNDRSELEIRQTSMTVVIDENIMLVKGHRWSPERFEEYSYSFQVSVCDVVCVKVAKAFGHVQQLGRIKFPVKCDYRGRLTRLTRFTPWFFLMNSSKVLFGIH